MNIYNVIILDESGSMSSIYKETLASMNEVLSGIRKNQEEFPEQRHYVTIVTFEGDGMKGVKTRRDRVSIDTVKPFSTEDYNPGGCTPLYDAIGKTLHETEAQTTEEDTVLVTIITDGMENSSREYNVNIIKNSIKRLQDKGWAITYIGANQDAKKVAQEMNVDIAMCWDSTPEGAAQMSLRSKKIHHEMAKCAYFKVSWDKVKEFVDKMGKEMDGE